MSTHFIDDNDLQSDLQNTKWTSVLTKNKVNKLPLIYNSKRSIPINITRRKSLVYAQVRTYNNSYETWEFCYFKYLLELYEIFIIGIKKLDIGIDTSSVNVFNKFIKFINQCSSGQISNYLDTIEECNLEEIYYEFSIKRNTL